MEDNIDHSQQVSNSDEAEELKAYFSAIEARVIGALMEKHLTTPKNYPLTINSLGNACNQKSNREPVMNLTEGQIGHTVNVLVERKLAGLDYGERANKVTHRVCTELDINRKQQAILSVLLLRKPQTLNDIKARTTRMVEFSGVEEIQQSINNMVDREMPLVVLIPKGSGRREDRYAHTLGGEVSVADIEKDPVILTSPAQENERLDIIEARLKVIEERLGIVE